MLFDIILAIVIVLFSVILHECAHGWVADRLGDPTARMAGRLTLNPVSHIDLYGTILFPLILKLIGSPVLLGWAKPVPVNFYNLRNPKRDMIWVSLSGPVTNFLIAIVSSQFLRLTGEVVWLQDILMATIVVNLVLATFNLIPIPPLDGGRVLVGLLPDRLAYRYAQVERIGMLLIFGLLYFGCLDFMQYVVKFLAGILLL